MNQIPHDKCTGKIIARINGELDAAENALFDSHVQTCPYCRRELREYELLSHRLHALERNVAVPALSPALLALKQEIAQHRVLEEAQQVLEQTLLNETNDSSFKEGTQSSRERVTQGSNAPTLASEAEALVAVRRAKEGDHDSFTVLYEYYFQQIYQHLYRMVGNKEDADDLAVETFFRAWRALPQMYDIQRFRMWLYTIATNLAIDFIRRKSPPKRRTQTEGSLDEVDSVELVARFEDRLEEQELIELALEKVSPKQRACLLLSIAGFSQVEIAKSIGMRKSSVGTFISTAREQFRKAYYELRRM